VPLARIPDEGWFNWFGAMPQPYNASSLRVDNNWPAASFEEWVEIVAASMPIEGNGEQRVDIVMALSSVLDLSRF
jgi:hypothetical protein